MLLVSFRVIIYKIHDSKMLQLPPSASNKTRSADHLQRNIESVGNVSEEITGAKLPSHRQVLQLFFYNLRIRKMKIRTSAKTAVTEALKFWEAARIPTREHHKCVAKLEELYDEWRYIHKLPTTTRTGRAIERKTAFVENLDDLFDVASANALETILIEEDKIFLLQQRKKGREGCMSGVDTILAAKEERSRQRKMKEELRRKKHEEASLQLCTYFIRD